MLTFASSMDFRSYQIPYRQTGSFNDLVLDYLDREKKLTPFYSHPISLQGVRAAIDKRKEVKVDRKLLSDRLIEQYKNCSVHEKVKGNIDLLIQDNCFTITTAHQNNLFTGPLYFIYKILHVIKLASHLNEQLPEFHFVPVFYMGSEDADLAELNHVNIEGDRLIWNTNQKGAVGRMRIDQELLQLIERLEGQLNVLPHGMGLLEKLRMFYKPGRTIAEATFLFVNDLMGHHGLIILNPDDASLKGQFRSIMEDELIHQRADLIVAQIIEQLEQADYPIQAKPRPINLFYLENDTRERIEQKGDQWLVNGTSISFSQSELIAQLQKNPEKFSPNVMLRGLYQCTILPDVAFVGGGGEISYWLEFKALFEQYGIPMPVLVLRNSFLLISQDIKNELRSMPLMPDQLFLPIDKLHLAIIDQAEKDQISLVKESSSLRDLYAMLSDKSAAVDSTLRAHVGALETKALAGVEALEKKLSRALRRKHTEGLQKVVRIKSKLFPQGNLQERYDNILPYLAKYGSDFLELLLEHSQTLEQEFTVVEHD